MEILEEIRSLEEVPHVDLSHNHAGDLSDMADIQDERLERQTTLTLCLIDMN